MISINSLVFKNHILKYGIVLDQLKREDGGVYCELVQSLENTKALIKVFLDFSGDDRSVCVGSSQFIYIGKFNKNKEIQNYIDKINKKERLYNFSIIDDFIRCQATLEFKDDFKSDTMDLAIIELLDLLDNNYRKILSILYR